ncbi:TPA: ATP-grasp domain-containing protein [Candidatus Woesearchaeota archaeon]|nr:ATP-grasp domain-containing protein [Candidatus Woesearchaeota archaeon]HIH31392.1 ATP-grasp domain-containing protein [Candidatus Woesearchaeota archaeon]HIH54403.1 ATP-grasp domain-containing protein [Candidatus Woesearchaeota archaeon]HIJ01075.1 ATP-grasp domain-containing protein [Candidatus Woesearchaeota archaeon]HIJ14123.1 ATP-grasp domain-containing protein [Candidatus Woesearchaeota archaeon]
MKVGILSNLFKESSEFKEVEEDLVEVGKAVKKVLEDAGHEAIFFDVNEKTYEELRRSNIDVAFNVCERFNGSSLFEPHIASMLELLNIPYTGSGPLTLATCINKVRVKEILMHHGILTPNYQVFYSRNKKIDPDLKFPLIVKPVCMDNSIGITADAVARNEEELRSKISYIIRTYDQPALAEEFIDGKEITVGILGNGRSAQVLPLSEVIFNNWGEEPEVYSYEAKWVKDSKEWKDVSIKCPADLPKYQEYRIKRTALQVYNVLGCRDYGRIDFRLSKDGVPYVLEMNPNPGISPVIVDGEQPDFMPVASEQAGMSYNELILKIFSEALDRNNMTIKILPAPKTNDPMDNPIAVELKESSDDFVRKK